MKKLLSVLLAFILIFTISVSAAENTEAGADLPDKPAEETEEADRSYVIPVRVGILYSVIVYRGGVSVVFNPITSKVTEVGLKVVRLISDVKEIKLYYQDGQTAVLPALIEVQTNDAGAVISLNLSVKTVTAVIDLFSKKSGLDKIAFVHSDMTEQFISLKSLDQALSDAFGCAVDVAQRAGKAIGTFLKNITNRIWTSTTESAASLKDSLISAWKRITESAVSDGPSVKDEEDKAEEKPDNFFENAAEKFKDFWNRLWKKKE